MISRVLKDRGLSKSGLAEALNVPNSAITAMLQGDRRILADEVPIIRKYLGLDTIPILGMVYEGMVRWDRSKSHVRLRAPLEIDENTFAIETRRDDLGTFFSSWYLVFQSPFSTNAVEAVGSGSGNFCIVFYEDKYLFGHARINRASALHGLAIDITNIISGAVTTVPILRDGRVKYCAAVAAIPERTGALIFTDPFSEKPK